MAIWSWVTKVKAYQMEPNYNFLNEGKQQTLATALDAYIKQRHTQEECIGFIDGYNTRMICKNGATGRESFFSELKRNLRLRWMELKYFIKTGKSING